MSLAPTPPEGEQDSPRPDSIESYLDASEEWDEVTADRDPPSDGSGPGLGRVPNGPDPATRSIDAGSQPPEPDVTLPSGQVQAPPERRGRGHVRGVARSVQLREVGNLEVLSFRVDQYDAAGNRLPPVGVELRPYRGGQVSDGEEIDVAGHWKDGTLRAKTVVNRTTGAHMTGGWSRWAYVGGTIFLLFFFGIPIAAVLIAYFSGAFEPAPF
jgi:hypothetical protein